MSVKPCPNCSAKLELIESYDSYACLACNVWWERQCGDERCHFCAARPERPSQALGLSELTRLSQEYFPEGYE